MTRTERREALERLVDWTWAGYRWLRDHHYGAAGERLCGLALALGAMKDVSETNLYKLAAKVEETRAHIFDNYIGEVSRRERQHREFAARHGLNTCRADEAQAPRRVVCTCDRAPVVGPTVCERCGSKTSQITSAGGLRVVCLTCNPEWSDLVAHDHGCPRRVA